jgi:beta-glucanase (GH16 family)
MLSRMPSICLSAFAIINTTAALPRCNDFDPNNPAASGYTLVFNSPFNGNSLDTTKWTIGWGPAGGGSFGGMVKGAYPNDEVLPENIYFANGVANLAVTLGAPTHQTGVTYGAAAMVTYKKSSQLYGYWEASIQLPTNAHGIWPTFWLLPDDITWPPEIDILEWLGLTPNIDYMTVHYGTDVQDFTRGGTFTSLTPGYHRYGLLWTPQMLRWYIDGVQRFQTSTGIPNKPMWILLNNDTGGFAGNVVDGTTVFSAILNVAYVQVWARR